MINTPKMDKSGLKPSKEAMRRDAVARTKTAGGRIQSADRIRGAKTKEDLDLEAKRLHLLKEIDKTSVGEQIIIPRKLKKYQQLILIIGSLNLMSSTEVALACKKLGYSGKLSNKLIKQQLVWRGKKYFSWNKQKGWRLTDKGEKEFSRLKQFI